MPATIRLMRFGKRGYAVYRVVVLDKRKKRNGSYVEKIGFYNPMTEPATFTIDEKKLDMWITRGALISDGMRKILKKGKKAVAAKVEAAPVPKEAKPAKKEAAAKKAAPKKKTVKKTVEEPKA